MGEAGRRLADRFRGRLRDAERGSTGASGPVARRFGLPGRSRRGVAVCGLSLRRGSAEGRGALEQGLVFRLGALSPHGIGERFSFH